MFSGIQEISQRVNASLPINIGNLGQRVVTCFQSNLSVPIVLTVIVVAAAIFLSYKYLYTSKPLMNYNDEKATKLGILMEVRKERITELTDQFNRIADHATKKDFKTERAEKALTDAITSLPIHSTCDHFQNKQSLENLKNSIENLQKTLKNDQDLSRQLNNLSSRVHQLQKYGIIKERFIAKTEATTFLETLQKPAKLFFRMLTQTIVDEINKMVYAGWAKKITDKNLKESIENELIKKYKNWGEKRHAEAQSPNQHQGVDAALAAELGTIQQVTAKDPRLEKMNAIEKKGEETRAQLVAIGGTRVDLEASDGVKLDATYLSAEEFLKTLEKSGALSGSIQWTPEETVPVVVIDKNAHSTLNLLRDLNLVTTPGKPGAGYCFITFPNDPKNVYLMHEKILDNYPEAFVSNAADGSITSQYPANWTSNFPKITTNLNNQNGAAILTSGNSGVYEMHKGEAMALLMQGMDVFMLNVRGYGQSEGAPSQDGSYLDIEAAYQYLKEKRKLPDNKIVAWSMCLSGGIGAYLAEKHPGMHLFLNQTYAEIASILKENISQKLEGLDQVPVIGQFTRNALTEIIFFALSFIAPNYNVKDRLKNVKGQVCTIQALSDTLMGQKETEAMAKIMNEQKIPHHRIQIPGQHCSNWTQVIVPQISVNTAAGVIRPQMQDYLKIIVDNESYYLPKESLKKEKGVKIGSRTFTKKNPDLPYQITVKRGQQSSNAEAAEVEVSDSRDFAIKITKSKGYENNSFTIKWTGHERVNGFLKAADLSRPLL